MRETTIKISKEELEILKIAKKILKEKGYEKINTKKIPKKDICFGAIAGIGALLLIEELLKNDIEKIYTGGMIPCN